MQTDNDGTLYRSATVRCAPQATVEDYAATAHSVVAGKPSTEEFLRVIHRDLKIRVFTQRNTTDYMGTVRRDAAGRDLTISGACFCQSRPRLRPTHVIRQWLGEGSGNK